MEDGLGFKKALTQRYLLVYFAKRNEKRNETKRNKKRNILISKEKITKRNEIKNGIFELVRICVLDTG